MTYLALGEIPKKIGRQGQNIGLCVSETSIGTPVGNARDSHLSNESYCVVIPNGTAETAIGAKMRLVSKVGVKEVVTTPAVEVI